MFRGAGQVVDVCLLLRVHAKISNDRSNDADNAADQITIRRLIQRFCADTLR